VDDDRESATPPPIMRNKAGAGGHRSRKSDGLVDGDGGVRLDGGAPIGLIPGRDSSRQGPKPGTSGSMGSVGGSGQGHTNGASLGGDGATLASGAGENVSTPASGGGNANSGGGKRRWLGIGRVGGLRKSTGGN